MVIADAEQQHVVEFIPRLPEPFDEGRARRALGVEPAQLVAERVPGREHLRRPSPEILDIALVRDGKALHGDAVDAIHTGRPVIAPAHVIERAGREHAYGRVARQTLRDVTRVQLCPAVDISAVALHHHGKLHWSSGPGSPGSPTRVFGALGWRPRSPTRVPGAMGCSGG